MHEFPFDCTRKDRHCHYPTTRHDTHLIARSRRCIFICQIFTQTPGLAGICHCCVFFILLSPFSHTNTPATSGVDRFVVYYFYEPRCLLSVNSCPTSLPLLRTNFAPGCVGTIFIMNFPTFPSHCRIFTFTSRTRTHAHSTPPPRLWWV